MFYQRLLYSVDKIFTFFFFKTEKDADIKLYKQHNKLAQQNNTVIHDAHLVQLGWVKVHGHSNEEVNVVQGLIWSISEHVGAEDDYRR